MKGSNTTIRSNNVLECTLLFGKSTHPFLLIFESRKEDESSEYGFDSDLSLWALCNPIRIPVVKKKWHIVLCVLNFIIPGTGTMLTAFPSILDKSEQIEEFQWALLIDGLLMFVLSIVIVGYLWSAWAGLTIYKKRKEYDLK